MNPGHDSKRKPAPAALRLHASTPFNNFSKLEAERQREWLFRRHRPARPAWKRD